MTIIDFDVVIDSKKKVNVSFGLNLEMIIENNFKIS